MSKKILNRIKAVLAEHDLNQTDLSEKLGKGRVTINRYCNNEQQPSLETIYKIAEILEVPLMDLLVNPSIIPSSS